MPLSPETFGKPVDRVYGNGEAGWLQFWREHDESLRRHSPDVDPVDGFNRVEDYTPMWEDER